MEQEIYELTEDLVRKALKKSIDDQKNMSPESKLQPISTEELKNTTRNNVIIPILSPKDKTLSEEESKLLRFLHDHFGETYDKVYKELYLELTDTGTRFMNASEHLMELIRGGINYAPDASRSAEEKSRQCEHGEEDKQEIKPGMKRGLTRRTLSDTVQAFNTVIDDEQSKKVTDKDLPVQGNSKEDGERI